MTTRSTPCLAAWTVRELRDAVGRHIGGDRVLYRVEEAGKEVTSWSRQLVSYRGEELLLAPGPDEVVVAGSVARADICSASAPSMNAGPGSR